MNSQIRNRTIFFLMIFTIVFVALIIRIGWIQYVEGDTYKQRVYLQQTQGNFIDAKRGSIYDRNYFDLAISSIAYNISIEPNKINEDDRKKIVNKLVSTLKVDEKDLWKKIKNKSLKYSMVKRMVDKEVGVDLIEFKKKNNIVGLNVEKGTKRYYPQKNMAAQVIGFTGTENQGLEGIESSMDEELKGIPGKILGETDARGKDLPFSQKSNIDPQNGLNVVLTIDKTIQGYADKALDDVIKTYKIKNGGVAIVMDPRNGDILAMVSKPDYDLNDPYKKPNLPQLVDKEWRATSDDASNILRETVWKNRAVTYTYEPGSTFKAITSAIGLEEDKIGVNTVVNDRTIKVAGNYINCWEPNAHGEQKFYQGVYNSCNPVFVKLALDIGIDSFYKYVRAFGFYDRTGIDLPSESGSEFHDKPKEIDLAVASFGQRFGITPVQLITSYAAIANGGNLVKPRIVKELTNSEGKVVKKIETNILRNVISQQTAKTLREILEGVVSKGTGANAYVKGYRVAGKTGTSETTETKTKGRFIASFSAFAPADNPVICVLVIADFPSRENAHFGGVLAAPAAAEIIEQTLTYLGVKRRNENDETEKFYKLQDVRGKTMDEAEKILKSKGFKVEIVKGDDQDNNTVIEQIPEATSEIGKGSIIMLYCEKDQKKLKVSVPDFKRLTVDEARNLAKRYGLNIITHGKGSAISQSFTPGVKIEKGRILNVEFIQQIKD